MAEERSVSQLERDLLITLGLIYKWQQLYRMVEVIHCDCPAAYATTVQSVPSLHSSDRFSTLLVCSFLYCNVS